MTATIAGEPAELGGLRMFAGDLTPEIDGLVTQSQDEGRTIMVVRWGGRFLGALGVMDAPAPRRRPSSAHCGPPASTSS